VSVNSNTTGVTSGARRVKGRRGMVPEVKQLYLAYSKRGDKVYTQISQIAIVLALIIQKFLFLQV
jgi:hypothetical protein